MVTAQLNSGIPFGFSQVGKFMTVYPRDADEALRFAETLHEATAGLGAPGVPYDAQFGRDSCVYYRYGAFGPQEILLETGERVGAILGPDEILIPDLREPGKAVPEWMVCPFAPVVAEDLLATPLNTRILSYEAMMQRGKGGVYRAIDLKENPAVLIVLKEGRRLGEVAWDGTDGRVLVENEEYVLRELMGCDVGSPHVIDSFIVDDNQYLALEYIEGESLIHACADPARKLSIDHALAYSAATADVVARIHRAGWAWRDCKPANLLVDKQGNLRPVDFEGAVRLASTPVRPWGTPGYMEGYSKPRTRMVRL